MTVSMSIFKRPKKQQQSEEILAKVSGWHKHPFAIPFFTLLILLSISWVAFLFLGGQTIGAKDSKIVQLYIDGQKRDVPTRAQTVEDLLARLNIQLDADDTVEPSLGTPISSSDFSINVYRAHPVTIIDANGKKTFLRVSDKDPRTIVHKAGIEVFPEDNVEVVTPAETLKDGVIGEKIAIDRATTTTVSLYDNTFTARTRAKTVGDLLKEKDIKLLEGDTLQPDANTPITPGLQIFIIRFGKQIVTVDEELAPPVETRQDAGMAAGTKKTLDNGKPGRRLVTYEVEVTNGKETARKELQSVVTVQPVKKIVVVGTKTNTFQGGLDAAMAALRGCESGGNYANKSNPKYRGAYQYDVATWNGFGGFTDPADAPPLIQDQKAQETYQRRGWNPWPTCSKKLGLQDSYR